MEKYPNDEYDMKLNRKHQISSPEVMAYDDQYIKDGIEKEQTVQYKKTPVPKPRLKRVDI